VRSAEFGIAEAEVWAFLEDFLVVFIEATMMATSSFASCSNGFIWADVALPESESISIQKPDSSASSSTLPNFEMKSAGDFARQAAR
jgi:hypothetical protein